MLSVSLSEKYIVHDIPHNSEYSATVNPSQVPLQLGVLLLCDEITGLILLILYLIQYGNEVAS
jgi:hypothetical protein